MRVTAQRCPINFARFRLQFFSRLVFNIFLLSYFVSFFVFVFFDGTAKMAQLFLLLKVFALCVCSKFNDFGSSWSVNQIVIARSFLVFVT